MCYIIQSLNVHYIIACMLSWCQYTDIHKTNSLAVQWDESSTIKHYKTTLYTWHYYSIALRRSYYSHWSSLNVNVLPTSDTGQRDKSYTLLPAWLKHSTHIDRTLFNIFFNTHLHIFTHLLTRPYTYIFTQISKHLHMLNTVLQVNVTGNEAHHTTSVSSYTVQVPTSFS